MTEETKHVEAQASSVEICVSGSDHLAQLASLYSEAFPDEELFPLVVELLDTGQSVISLVAVSDDVVVGHVCFTLCEVGAGAERVALLGPLCVAPAMHRQGIGSALVRAGLKRLANEGMRIAYVLGDPDYYSRFGFEQEDRVVTPYPLPSEWRGAWQSLCLADAANMPDGELIVPPSWRHPELWTE